MSSPRNGLSTPNQLAHSTDSSPARLVPDPNAMTAHSQASESDLIVFVSSRINEELKRARTTAVDTINGLTFARAWTFEHTTASSEPPEDTYLRKVRESDFVVWLVGTDTTQPVIDEINMAISSNCRLLAFALPADHRDNATKCLIDFAGKYAKWTDVRSHDELSTAIKTSLSDELIRAVRNPEAPGRRKRLIQDHRLSVSRCKEAWQSLGISEDIARNLAEDKQLGHILDIHSPGAYTIVGDQGSGKTLAVERIFQNAVDVAIQDSSRPHPVFVRARDLNTPIRQLIEDSLAGHADPFNPRVILLVDGLDEMGPMRGSDISQQLKIYADANPRATMIATARPLPSLRLCGEQMQIDELDECESIKIIAKVSGQSLTTTQFHGWPMSIRDAVRLPLFAVMTGSLIVHDASLSVASQGQLIEQLARRALAHMESDGEELDGLLQKLAVLAIENGKGVHLSEVTSRYTQEQMLLSSRLVTQSDTVLNFALPVFREWYASRAIIEGTISIEDFRPRSDRWVPSLSVVLSSENDRLRHALITNLILKEPSLASLLLKNHSPDNVNIDARPWQLSSADDAGTRLRQTMMLWRSCLGDLFSIIGPVDESEEIATLAVHLDEQYLTTAWRVGDPELPPVVPLDEHIQTMRPPPGWPTYSLLSLTRDLRDPFWWTYTQTQRELAESLSKALDTPRLALCSEDARHELSWRFLLDVLGSNRPTHSSFSLEAAITATQAFLRAVRSSRPGTVVVSQGGMEYSEVELHTIDRLLLQLRAQSCTEISDPWPSGDRSYFAGGYVWGNYSEERLLERTTAVYSGALRIYSSIAKTWLPCFAKRLKLFSRLPMRLEGRVSLYVRRSSTDQWPNLSWYGRILPEDQDSEVAFELGSTDRSRFDSDFLFQQEQQAFAAHRREAPSEFSMSWVSTSLIDLFKSDPATRLAHEWLRDDLGELGWRSRL